MSGVNTNIMSMTAQRNLGTNSASLATTMNRLSSGLRVNSAKDDAAGLAIAERMNAQVKGMNVAMRNANDGISMAQTAEGGLSKIGDSMQRMRELAVQARNSTNSDADKEALNKEYQTLRQEIGRVIESTKFNGKSVLSADSNLEFQVGAGTSTSDRVGIKGLDLKVAEDIAAVTKGFKQTDQIKDLAKTAADNIAGTMKQESVASTASAASASADTTATPSASKAAVASQAGKVGTVAANTKFEELSDANKAKLADSLGVKVADINAGSTIEGLVGAKIAGTAISNGAAQTTAATATAAASTLSEDLQEFAATNSDSSIAGSATDIDAVINKMDAALNTVNGTRASFGAAQTRMEAVIGNLQVASENQSAARSRIMDTNYAMETANLSRSQVLQQASQAMLAQANQAPQAVLQLLR